MPAERFYIDSDLTCGTSVSLTGDEFTHLVKVMRGGVGDSLELINGRHILAKAQIEKIDKHAAELSISLIEEHAPCSPSITLAVGLPRFNHLEWIVEKVTEVGANALWLFPGDLSEKKTVSEQQLIRIHNLMVAAVKQCGRLDMPSLSILPPLHSWHYPPEGSLFFGDTSPDAPLLFRHLPPKNTPIFFFTGPEKGFSTQEKLLLKNAWHVQGVSLLPHILRAETAPILATAILRHML